METAINQQESAGGAAFDRAPLPAFAVLLMQLRTARGLSQHRLGLLSCVAPSSVIRIEKGERGVPTAATVHALADGLELAPHEAEMLFAAAIRSRHAEAMKAVDAFRKEMAGSAMTGVRRGKR